MNGCVHGRWVLGAAHNNCELGATVASGVFNDNVYNHSLAVTDRVGNRVVSAAECMTLVQLHFPDANGAQYSNDGHLVCDAVFDA